MSISSTIKQKTSQLFDAVRNGRNGSANREVPPRLAELVTTYENSSTARYIQAEFEAVRAANSPGFSSSATSGEVSAPSNGTIDEIGERVGMIEMRDVVGETGMLRGRRSASWPTQFRILSGRAFKNLYRDPALLMAHYFGSIVLACECRVSLTKRILICVVVICGLFFHNVGNDIAGFQNRLGEFHLCFENFVIQCSSFAQGYSSLHSLYLVSRVCRAWHCSQTRGFCSCERGM